MPKKRVNITLSQDVYEQLQKDANSNCRSVSEEIEYRLKTPASPYSTPAPFTPISTPENPTGGNIITADGTTHKKHPLIWLQENNIDPMDTNSDTFHRFQKVYPDATVLEFYDYQQSRRK